MSNILLTGGSGFIGRHLTASLSDSDRRVILAGRSTGTSPSGQEAMLVRPYNLLDDPHDTDGLFDNVETVIHLAGLAHDLSASAMDYKRMNTDASINLALAAARTGVRRFILMSTVKVHGESTAVTDGHYMALTEQSALMPGDDYSISKLRAEEGLQDICSRYDMQFIILRPPLVFGPGVRANFFRLLHAITAHWPLPLSAIRNRRSMIYVGNLCDMIGKLINDPAIINQVYLTKDIDYSTPELVHSLAVASGIKPLLFPVPDLFLGMLGKLPKCTHVIARLRDSLLIDDTKIRHQLEWSPPVSPVTAIEETVEWYMTTRQ